MLRRSKAAHFKRQTAAVVIFVYRERLSPKQNTPSRKVITMFSIGQNIPYWTGNRYSVVHDEKDTFPQHQKYKRLGTIERILTKNGSQFVCKNALFFAQNRNSQVRVAYTSVGIIPHVGILNFSI